MAMSRTYYSVDGKIRGEHRSGETHSRDYLHDALGSVVAVFQNGNQIAEGVYKPYGYRDGEWQMDSYKFSWNGGWGYRRTGMAFMANYVRARHYSQYGANWNTVDPLWPNEMPYGYMEGRVMKASDYWGLQSVPAPYSVPVGPPSLRIIPGGGGSSVGTGGAGTGSQVILPSPGSTSQNIPYPPPPTPGGDPFGGTPHADGGQTTAWGIRGCFCAIWRGGEWLGQQAFRGTDYIEAPCANLDTCKDIYALYKTLFPTDVKLRTDPSECDGTDSCVSLDLKMTQLGRRIEVMRKFNSMNCYLIYGSPKPDAKAEHDKKLKAYVSRYKSCLTFWKSRNCPWGDRRTGPPVKTWGIPEPGSIDPITGFRT